MNFIHVDLDAFYASVEQLDNPDYRGKPVIVGSLPTDRRGVVSTCSYEARQYGVHSAMPIATAFKLCPQGIFIRGRMDRYHQKSREVMSVFAEFSPDIQQISVDEAFIDITGTERLFGNSEEIAKKIKNRVYEKTGLTVSVGVASTKYIAKISSGMSKPDGLFIVEEGKEEEFMLSLPLTKVWGIGEKTRNRITRAGFFTTKDLHNVSETLLKTLFGCATGTFLFHAVRGELTEIFSSKPKSRSISSEKTFSFDLTDRYIIETALMELSWDIMFRLFTENLTSKTAQLKIRYEDFTTVTIQETSTRSIASTDDLFTRITKLFNKKYENGRGIRLLGIATQNIEDGSAASQQDLFDFENAKKAQLEKTVIELQKKNPTVKIRKARLLKDFTVMILLSLGSIFLPQKLTAEDPIAIFNFTPNSPNIEFYAEGFWEATVLTGFDLYNNNNSGLGFSFTPPLFMQKTSLNVWFELLDSWYFEANIADDFLESTVAAGYQSDGIVKHARVGNRLIQFPQFYGITETHRGIGSGSNQAPGIMAEFSQENWRADAIIRYDMTEPVEKTWVGNNEYSETTIHLSDWQTGARFIFPDNLAEYINAVYVENEEPNERFIDSEGIRYKKLSPSEYIIIPSKNMLVLDVPQENTILVTFSNTIQDLGSFSTETGFFGETQKWFGDIDIENFVLGDTTNDFLTTINSGQALIIQKKDYFSPFVDASLYSTSNLDADTVRLISESTKKSIDSHSVQLLDSSSMEIPGFTNTDFFNEKKAFIHASNTNERTILASKQFPFAKENPLIYLVPQSDSQYTQTESNAIIVVQDFTQSPIFDIGFDVIAGSISVYRNGIQENLFTYDSKTGIVQLTNPPDSFDTIKITWQQNAENASTGTLTSALGYQYIFSPELSINISSSVLWPIMSKDAFSVSSARSNNSINLALDVAYTNDDITIDNVLSTSFYTNDVTNTYRIDSMDSSKLQIKNLSKNAGLEENKTLVPTLEKRPNSTINIPVLNLSDKGETTTTIVRDAESGNYVIENNWSIEKQNGYIYQTIDFLGTATALASSETFSIRLKQENMPQNYSIYLQLGVKDNNNPFETTSKIPTWELTSTDSNSNVDIPFERTNNNWQTIEISLCDEDRAKLSTFQNARIILVNDDSATKETGKLSIGSYSFSGTSFTATDQLESKECYVQDSGKNQTDEMLRFNQNSANIVQYFSWDSPFTTTEFTATKYYDLIPIENYRYLNFFSYIRSIDPNSSIQIVLDTPTEDLPTLDIELNEPIISLLTNNWHLVSFDMYTNTLYIDGNIINSQNFIVNTNNTSSTPNRINFIFTGNGSIYIDELHLEDTSWQFKAENALNIDWHKKEVLVGTKNNPIIANPRIQMNNTITSNTAFELPENTSIGLVSESLAEIDILGIHTQGSIQFNSSNKNPFSILSAGHRISTTPVYFPLKIMQFSESYVHSPKTFSSKKVNSFGLDFSPLNVNLQTSLVSDAQNQQKQYIQNTAITSHFDIGTDSFEYDIEVNLLANQNGNHNTIPDSNYFNSWLDISKIQFSTGLSNSNNRTLQFRLQQVFNFKNIYFSPNIEIEGNNVLTQSQEIKNSASDRFSITFPFSINKNKFSTTFTKKSFLDSTRAKSNTYIDDTTYYIENVTNRNWAYKTAPIYDFFDSNITINMQKTLQTDANLLIAGYSTLTKFTWSRDLYITPIDLLIPKSIDLSLSRDIRATTVSTSDILQFATTLNFLSINNFGKFGTISVFNWYEQDEILQSFKIIFKTDKKDIANWRLEFAGYNQTTLYFNTYDTLRLLTEAQVDTKSNWTLKHTTKWDRKGISSFIVDGLYNLFPSMQDNHLGFTRSNSLMLAFSDSKDSTLSQMYGITHSVTIDIHEYLQIGLELGSDLRVENNSFSLANLFSITGKVEF